MSTENYVNETLQDAEENPEEKLRSSVDESRRLEAIFWLIAPECYGEVQEAKLVIYKNEKEYCIPMQHESAPSALWITFSTVERGQKYRYEIKCSKKSWIPQSVWPEIPTYVTEQRKRKVLEHCIQKDIFGQPTDKKTVLAGYKVFFEKMIIDLKTEDDLSRAIEDYEKKHWNIVAVCDRNGMTSLINLSLSTISKSENSKGQIAVFTLYLISKMYPAKCNWYGSNNMKLLLDNLRTGKSMLLPSEVTEGVAETLVDILCNFFGIYKCSWFDFVEHSYQFLPCECLTNKISKFYSKFLPSDGYKRLLCILLDCCTERPDCEVVIVELLKMAILDQKVEILMMFNEKLPPDCSLISFTKIHVVDAVKETLSNWCYLNQISNIISKIKEADECLLQQLNNEFEEAIIYHLNRKIDDHSEILNLICSECFFTDRQQTFKMMNKIVISKFKETHSLFPQIAQEQKFTDTLNSDSKEALLIVQAWLETAKAMRSSFGYYKDWYMYVLKIMTVVDRLQDEQIRSNIESSTITSAAKCFLSEITAVRDIMKLGEFLKAEDPMSEKVLVEIRSDLESSVLRIVKKNSGWNKTEIIDNLLLLLHSQWFFTESNSAVKILDAIAASEDLNLHSLLPRAMCEKFLKLSFKDLNMVFEHWIKTAKSYHCEEKIKSQRNSKNSNDKVEQVIVLYDYLTKFLVLDITYEDLKQNVETMVKEEFKSLNASEQFRLVELIDKQREELSSISELVVNHYEQINTDSLSESDILNLMKNYEEVEDIDIMSSAKSLRFKVFLKSLNSHLQSFKSDADKEVFVFSHAQFWLKILSYQGVHDDVLKSHDVMCLMTQITKDFAAKVMSSSISLNEFLCLKGVAENAAILIARLCDDGKFLNHWNKLKSGYEEAKQNCNLLSTLCSKFVIKMEIVVSDIEAVRKSVEQIKEKLDANSCSTMDDINRPEFFSNLTGFIEPAKKLNPLGDFTTFINLCKLHLRNKQALNKSDSDLQEKHASDMNLSMLFEEEKNIKVSDVIKCLENECAEQYKEWLLKIAKEDATMTFATKYGTKRISEEVNDACKYFEIPIEESTLEALKWLNSLKDHKENAARIKMILPILGLNETLNELYTAIDSFFNCIECQEDVTISRLACVMHELKDELSSKDDDWWDLIEELSKSKELVDFIKRTLDDDFRNLIDAVEEQSEQTIDESTVSDLIQVKQFLQMLLRHKFAKSQEFFDAIKKSMQKEGRDISNKINNCCHNLHGLIALYQHVANRGELTKEIIKNAMTAGKYTWSLEKDDLNCTVVLTYSNHSYRLEDLSDLRSRALLLSNSEKREKDQNTELKVDLHCFVNAVDIIQEITSTMTELHQLGHFSFRTYGKEMQSGNELLSNLRSFLSGLTQELEEWKHTLEKCRDLHQSLNYVYSDQLFLLCNFLSGNRQDVQQIQNILKFVHPGATVEALTKYELVESDKEMLGCEKLNLIGCALDKMIQDTKIKRTVFPDDEKFLKQSKDVKAVVECGTLQIVHLDIKSTQTIPTLLSLYANTERHFPVPNEVLFCHEFTSWEEIQLLLTRCIRAKNSELHCICNVEKLHSILQTFLVEELSTLLESGNLKYRLAIICRGAEHNSITDYFASYVTRLPGFDTATVQSCLKKTWQNVCMVTSSVPGLGKTEQIKNLAADNNRRIETVHISGPISRNILVTLLQNQKLENCNALHLDIGEVDDPYFLDACLFEYIVLGCLCSGTKVACLPTSHIAIEVANTVQNKLRDSLVILSSFNREHLEWTDYEQVVISNEICSPIQIVCNYLKLYDEGTLDKKDIVLNRPLSATPLDPETCRKLLKRHFCSTTDSSYSVTEIFVNVFGEQLKRLSNSSFFRVNNVNAMVGDKDTIDVRSKLVNALLDVAKEFATRSVLSCRSVQTATLVGADASHSTEEKTVHKLTQAELMAHRVAGMLHWADSNHLLITFNGIDSQTVSVLYRVLKNVPENVKKFFKSQLKKELPDVNNLSKQELQNILERITRSSSQKMNTTDVDATYALTPDNILKMILILLRIRANIPVVIMGETGCGKTSLIRYLARICDTEFEHFSIHAGITVEMITKAVRDSHDRCRKNLTKQVWLFFDEINSCDHLGLLAEIICHHSCFGKALAKNLVFIAACNPYRLREDHQIMTAGLEGKVKTDSFSKLVYRVHPLPETMIDYVWDYGTLHKDDEQSYIKQMVSNVFPEAKPEWLLREKITGLLVKSQQFIRDTENCDWCVSLRDVYRCQMLMTQFLKMLNEKKEHILDKSNIPDYYKADDEKRIYICAIVLALAHCYQSRLATTQNRNEFWKGCSEILLDDSNQFEELRKMVRYEQLDLLNRMDLPQGIAKNTALCENVFVILVCILNRIPVFLVGKPGCSKSLSVQLIKSNLRGRDSSNSYFQTLPNLYIVTYQGSESSTSEGIIKVFNKAKKYGEGNKDHGVLPVVLLDEVGLAEASRFNPLKVLHGLLEPATGELPSVAVVGISNWALDAAKMNRAIYLSRPDMDFQELYETGKSISSGVHSSNLTDDSFDFALNSRAQVNDDTLRVLADAYCKYQQKQLIKNFHGLRDYYALIKYISRLVNEQENNSGGMKLNENQIVQRGLLRNFGGTEYGVSELIKHISSSLSANFSQKWPTEEIILDNLKDKLARHLMLITSGDSSMGILIKCLNNLDRKYVTIFGSNFEEDQTEDYSYRILSRIILCMEAGSVLILKDLDTIYGSLYDMLNQNYTVVGKKKNCRIALGPNSNPMCQVHDEFRCIVLVDVQRVNYSDPPFLNRFEKQILKFETIIGDEQKKIIKELENQIDDFSKIANMSFIKENAFIGLNQDTVSSVVYQIGQHRKLDYRNTVNECHNALLWLVPPDAVLRGNYSEYSVNSHDKIKALQRKYFDRPIHQGLSHFLSVVLKANHKDLPPVFSNTAGVKIVVYTHSNIYVDLRKIMKQHEPLQVEKLGSFKSEKQLTKQIRLFFESDNRLLILQCEPREDGKHIPLAKFQLEEHHQECANKSEKHICIVLHMERVTTSAVSTFGHFSFLSGWQLAVIDNLEQESYPLTETLKMNISEVLKTEFCSIAKCIQKNLVWAFTCTSSSYRERSMEEFLQLVTQISESKDMISCLADCILKCIARDENNIDSLDLCDTDRWQVKVACDMRLLHSATSFTDALKQHLTRCVTVPLANLVYLLEKLSAWNSYFQSSEAAEIWGKVFKSSDMFSLDEIEIPQGPGSFKIDHKPLKLQCPFSQIFVDKLCKKEELFKQDIMDPETTASGSKELNSCEYYCLFEKYMSLFESDMLFMASYELLSSFEQEIIYDICNCLTLGYVLEEDERIEVTLWLIKIKAYPHVEKSPEISITESLLCLWKNQPLLHALLQLISECRSILPCSVKDVLLTIGKDKQLEGNTQETDSFDNFHSSSNSGGYKSFTDAAYETKFGDKSNLPSDAVSEVDKLEQQQDDVESSNTELCEEDKDPEDLAIDHNSSENDNQNEPLASKIHLTSNDLKENDNETPGDDEEKLKGEESKITSEENEAHDFVYDRQQEFSDIKPSDDKKGQNENFTTDETDLQPEERLVHFLCKLLLPSATLLKECEGVSGWQGRVCSILSFCSSVSKYPISFHALRIFNDLATVLCHCNLDNDKIDQILLQLSEDIDVNNLENSLNSVELYERVIKLYENMEGVAESDFECFACMYIGRLIDVNPETELFGHFLMKAAKLELLDKNLSQIELLLHRVLLEMEAKTLEDSLLDLLKKPIDDKNEDLSLSPQLAAINEALLQVDLKKPQFLILCTDVIQDRVMKYIEWQDLDNVNSPANDLLFMLKTANEVIGMSKNGSLHLATSLAFVKEFLHHLAEMLVYDYDHQEYDQHFVLYQNVNALLNNNDCWNYLLQKLKFNRSYDMIKKLLASVENLMPNIAKSTISTMPNDDLSLALGYKVLGNSTERNSKLETSLLEMNSPEKEKVVDEFVKDSADEKQLLSLFEALIHVAYIPNSRRLLNDTEKQIGTWFKDKENQLPNKYVIDLVQRITNLESFGTSLLKITQKMDYTQLHQSVFLLHLISVTVMRTVKSSGKGNLLSQCLMNSNAVFKWSQSKYSNSSSRYSVNIKNCFLVTCKCWSRVVFSENCDTCPVCGSELNNVGGPPEKFAEMNLLCTADANFEIKALASETVRLFIDAMLLCSLGIGTLDTETIKAVCESPDCENLIQNRFGKRWNQIQELLQLDPEELSLFLHNIVDRSDLFDDSFDFVNQEFLQQQLLEVEGKFEALLQQPSLFSDVKLYHKSISVISPDVQNFQEFPTDFALLPTKHTSLFRQNRRRTLANMRAQYYLRKKEVSHPVLDLFFKKSHHLNLLQHLMPLIKWSLVCHQVVNHRFTRDECKNLTLQKLIQSKPTMEDVLKKLYENFMESWEELRSEENLAVLHIHDSTLPTKVQSKHDEVCENSDSLLYKVMKALVTIQNKFLTELLFIAQSGKCPSLGFLTKNFPNMATIKAVLLQNLKEDEIITYTCTNAELDLVMYGQNNVNYGLGSQAVYNFVKIEMELANMLSLGKAYIVMNQTFPFVIYANEMFVACASVLREFKTIIPQKPIGSFVKEGIKKKMENNRDFVNQMMRQIEILLCLAQKTGGSPEQTLRSYNQVWLKTLPGGFAEDNLIFEGEPLCLSHLVALYEFLENLQADAAIKSMSPEFKKSLPKSVEKELKDFADTNHIELTSIQVAFRRFVMRHLINFDPEKMDRNTPLIQWMAEPSLWEKGVKENGELDINKEGGTPKMIKSEFPQKLNLEHTFYALDCINEMIEERTRQRPKWLQVERTHVTGSAAASAARPQQGRQRARANIGKT